MTSELHAVTGAFGYSGKYIMQRLLDAGCRVLTLTNRYARKLYNHLQKVIPWQWKWSS